MNCLGCYNEVKEGYCINCRKKLFDKAKVSAVLSFDAPKDDNLAAFQEHTKRLSISGVQLKYSLRLEENELKLCDKKGQYILKPIPPTKQLIRIDDVPENEHLTMQIAEQVFKINTAKNALICFSDGQQAYLTRRFDVKPDGSKLMQEDFAQLTNRTKYTHGETFKYDGSYEEIGLIIKRFVAAAMPALENFFQLVVFNYVFSNGDAHLKNFSLLLSNSGEYQLSPAYDLLSTVIHSPQEFDTALDLYDGDMNSAYYQAYGHYGRSNFMELAKRLGIVETRAARIINQFGTQKEQACELINRSCLSSDVKRIYTACMIEKLKRFEKK